MSQTVFSQRVAQLIDEHKLTYREVEQYTGIKPSTISRWINGDENINPQMIPVIKFAGVFHVTVDWLIGLSEERTRQKKCKYCDLESKEWEYSTFPINLGDLGDGELSVWVSKTGQKIGVDFGMGKHEPIITKYVKIKYCPFCGVKFEENKHE